MILNCNICRKPCVSLNGEPHRILDAQSCRCFYPRIRVTIDVSKWRGIEGIVEDVQTLNASSGEEDV